MRAEHVDFTGTGASDQWRAVISKKLLGSEKGRNFYQWYLSIYALRRGAYRLRYQSPGNGGPLSRVTQANGVKLWFPTQEIDIVGAAALMHRRTQELVVAIARDGGRLRWRDRDRSRSEARRQRRPGALGRKSMRLECEDRRRRPFNRIDRALLFGERPALLSDQSECGCDASISRRQVGRIAELLQNRVATFGRRRTAYVAAARARPHLNRSRSPAACRADR